MKNPQIILLISGKRKSGKDYISETLKNRLKENCSIIRISEPIKTFYAQKHNLNLSEMMSDGPYKEQHRLAMIKWSEDVRRENSGYFCHAACSKAPYRDIWIVSDIRRKTDIEWFKKSFGKIIRTIRIDAESGVRKARGWRYTEGVDDVTSECDLDDYMSWDLCVQNNDEESCNKSIEDILILVS